MYTWQVHALLWKEKKKSGLKLKGCTIRSEKLICKNAMFLLFLGIQFMIGFIE